MLVEDSVNSIAMVNHMKTAHKHTVCKFLDRACIKQAKPQLGLSSGRLYREVAVISSVLMFDWSL